MIGSQRQERLDTALGREGKIMGSCHNYRQLKDEKTACMKKIEGCVCLYQ